MLQKKLFQINAVFFFHKRILKKMYHIFYKNIKQHKFYQHKLHFKIYKIENSYFKV